MPAAKPDRGHASLCPPYGVELPHGVGHGLPGHGRHQPYPGRALGRAARLHPRPPAHRALAHGVNELQDRLGHVLSGAPIPTESSSVPLSRHPASSSFSSRTTADGRPTFRSRKRAS